MLNKTSKLFSSLTIIATLSMSPTFAAQKYTPESDTINIQSFFDGLHKKAACTPYPLCKSQKLRSKYSKTN
jgi:hypothetical protein